MVACTGCWRLCSPSCPGATPTWPTGSTCAWPSFRTPPTGHCTTPSLAAPTWAPGRLLNVLVLVVAAYAFLTAYWKPVERALGWFLIPLGRATLYVFIMHVVLIAVIANIPALRQGDILVNTAAYAVILGLLWVMVKKRVLFGIIPT